MAEHVKHPAQATQQTLPSSMGEAVLDCASKRRGLGERAGASPELPWCLAGEQLVLFYRGRRGQDRLAVQSHVLRSQEAEAACRSLASRSLPTNHLQTNAPGSTRVPLTLLPYPGPRGQGRDLAGTYYVPGFGPTLHMGLHVSSLSQ